MSRSEVLAELGAVIAKLRERRDEKRDKNEPADKKVDHRIDALQTGYEFIMTRWTP